MTIIRVFSTIALTVALLVAAAPSVRAAEAPATFAAASGAPAAAVDSKALAVEAKALGDAEVHRLGPAYSAYVDERRHIVYVAAVDRAARDRVVAALGAWADAEQRFIFHQPLQWNVVVLLPTMTDFRKNIAREKSFGQYNSSTRTLVTISVSEILLHEFTHALHHNDQAIAGQHHPVWLVEGLAMLLQQADLKAGNLAPRDEPSLELLQEAARQGKIHALEKLCHMDQPAFLSDADICYPQSRYLLMYLYRLGKLTDFYEAYKLDYAADRSGLKTFERILGRQAGEIDADWLKWLLALKPAWKPAGPQFAQLGIQMAPGEGGVRVTGFLAGSAAERAALLKPGDLIISLAGLATATPAALTAAVQTCRPGQTVTLELIRDGRPMTIEHLLGFMPK